MWRIGENAIFGKNGAENLRAAARVAAVLSKARTQGATGSETSTDVSFTVKI